MEELLARHKKQQRDLQSQITQKKKSASKKARKGVNDECTQLETDLKSRQEQELAAFDHQDRLEPSTAKHTPDHGQDEDSSDLLASIAKASISEAGVVNTVSNNPLNTEKGINGSTTESKKPNRQKARLARRAAEQEAASAQAAEEAANLPNMKARERERMLKEIKERGLQEEEVAANGHCLYLAVADQMNQLRPASKQDVDGFDYKKARNAAADYMSQHPDDFVSFLEEPLDAYLRKIRDTGEWGGQLELLALAKAYEVNINVLQGNGRVEEIHTESAASDQEVWLAYYLHGFGLGEHYNSLRKVQPTT